MINCDTLLVTYFTNFIFRAISYYFDSSKINFNSNFAQKQVTNLEFVQVFSNGMNRMVIHAVYESSDEAVEPPGGVFGTAKNQKRLNLYLKAFGILALVYLFARLLQF